MLTPEQWHHHTLCSFRKTPPCTCKGVRVEKANHILLTVDPWTTQELGAMTLCAIKNPRYSWFLIPMVSTYPWFCIYRFNQPRIEQPCRIYCWWKSTCKQTCVVQTQALQGSPDFSPPKWIMITQFYSSQINKVKNIYIFFWSEIPGLNLTFPENIHVGECWQWNLIVIGHRKDRKPLFNLDIDLLTPAHFLVILPCPLRNENWLLI